MYVCVYIFILGVTNPYIKGEKNECMCVYIHTHIHTFFFPIRWKIYIGINFFFILQLHLKEKYLWKLI